MKNTFKIELTIQEWMEIIATMNLIEELTESHDKNEKLAEKQIGIVEKIEEQIIQTKISLTKK